MNIKSTLIVIVTLLLGMLIGFLLAGRMAHKKIRHIQEISRDHRKECKHLANRLELTAEQQDQIEPIMQQHLESQHALKRMHRSEMDSLRDEMFIEITPMLDQKQLNTLEQIKEGRRARRHKKRKRIQSD